MGLYCSIVLRVKAAVFPCCTRLQGSLAGWDITTLSLCGNMLLFGSVGLRCPLTVLDRTADGHCGMALLTGNLRLHSPMARWVGIVLLLIGSVGLHYRYIYTWLVRHCDAHWQYRSALLNGSVGLHCSKIVRDGTALWQFGIALLYALYGIARL